MSSQRWLRISHAVRYRRRTKRDTNAAETSQDTFLVGNLVKSCVKFLSSKTHHPGIQFSYIRTLWRQTGRWTRHWIKTLQRILQHSYDKSQLLYKIITDNNTNSTRLQRLFDFQSHQFQLHRIYAASEFFYICGNLYMLMI